MIKPEDAGGITEGMINVAKAAKKLKRTTAAVTEMCRQGRIAGAVKIGSSWLIPAENVKHKLIPKRKPGRKRKADGENR